MFWKNTVKIEYQLYKYSNFSEFFNFKEEGQFNYENNLFNKGNYKDIYKKFLNIKKAVLKMK